MVLVFRELMEIRKYLFHIVPNAMPFALTVKKAHQGVVIPAHTFIGIAIDLLVSLFQTGKIAVQSSIKIWTASVPQGHSHTETEDALHSSVEAIVQNPPEVLLRVVEKGEYGGCLLYTSRCV